MRYFRFSSPTLCGARESACASEPRHTSYIKNQKYKKKLQKLKTQTKIYFYYRISRWSRISGRFEEIIRAAAPHRFHFSRPEVNFNHRVLIDTANASTIIRYQTRFNWSSVCLSFDRIREDSRADSSSSVAITAVRYSSACFGSVFFRVSWL